MRAIQNSIIETNYKVDAQQVSLFQYGWCFYLTVCMTLLTGVMTYILDHQAKKHQARQVSNALLPYIHCTKAR